MKTLLLLFGVLLSTAAGREATVCCIKAGSDLPAVLAAAEAEKNGKPPTPAQPSAPAPKRNGKERGTRPAPPAHLFM